MHDCGISDAKVHEHIGDIAEVEIELTMLGAFLRTVRRGVGHRLASYDVGLV